MAAQPASAKRIVANTSALSAASLWRIGVAFALQVVVGRMLGAAGLGSYALAMALLNVAQICVEAGMPALLVRELAPAGSPRRAGYLQARTIMVSVALLIALGAAAGALLMSGFAGSTRGLALALLFLSLPFYALQVSSLTVFEAGERFELVLLFDGLANGALLLAGMVVLVAGGSLTALFVTLVAVQALVALPALLTVRRMAPWFAQGADSKPAPRRALVRRALPTFGLALTDVLQQRIDLLLVGLLASPAITGLYAAATALVRVLVKLAQAWWRALFPTLSRMHGDDVAQAGRLTAMATRLGTLFMVGAAALLTTAAEPMVTLIFGAEYAPAASALRILAWSAPLYLLLARAMVLLLVVRRPRAALLVALAQVAAVLILLPIAVVWSSSVTFAVLAVVAAAGVALAVSAWLLADARRATAAEMDGFPTSFGRSALTVTASASVTALIMQIPAGWPLQSLLAGGAVLALCALTGTLHSSDFARLRQVLRPEAGA
jgi:O-antigen/teichoic acid export membrane protein